MGTESVLTLAITDLLLGRENPTRAQGLGFTGESPNQDRHPRNPVAGSFFMQRIEQLPLIVFAPGMLDGGDDSDHAYFQAIEEIFVRLRGAPLLLSPVDWQVASRWHREGVPLDLVGRVLEEVFAKRRERGTKGTINSLRYCAPAVEAAWADLRELTAPGERTEAAPLDISGRLRNLAAAVPAAFAARVAGLHGDAPSVEAALSALDREMLAASSASLAPELRKEVEAAVEKTLAALKGRLPADEVERSRERLTHQVLRQRLGLPVLSLFSPEAQLDR
ncbi:MAG: hypothetical protein ACJ759_04800 [Thermoanaerobaculia bacterium]